MGDVNSSFLPGLSRYDYKKLINPPVPKGFNKKEKRRYHGFEDFLKVKHQNNLLAVAEKKKQVATSVRAAFFVDWDPQSLYSLQNHINELNTVMPEWFFIDPVTDTLQTNIDKESYDLMKRKRIRILPMLNNVNLPKHDGTFDPGILDPSCLEDS